MTEHEQAYVDALLLRIRILERLLDDRARLPVQFNVSRETSAGAEP